MRFLFENRLWDAVPDGLESLSQHAKQIDMDRLKLTEYGWQHQLYQQYLAFRILWEGRLGNDETVKTLLREMYAAMDMASERGGRFRQGGGLTEVRPWFTPSYCCLNLKVPSAAFETLTRRARHPIDAPQSALFDDLLDLCDQSPRLPWFGSLVPKSHHASIHAGVRARRPS